MKHGNPDFAALAARLRAGTVTPADLDAAADVIEAAPVVIEALEWLESRRIDAIRRAEAINAEEDAAVLALCEKHGFCAVIDSACRQWTTKVPYGNTAAFFVGGCIGDTTCKQALAALKGATP